MAKNETNLTKTFNEINGMDMIDFLIMLSVIRQIENEKGTVVGTDGKEFSTEDFRFDHVDLSEPEVTAAIEKYGIDVHSKSKSPILDLIAKHESDGDYNIVYGGARIPLTQMTVHEVLDWQREQVARGVPSAAAGRYQFIAKTLAGLVEQGVVNGSDLFNEATQDKLAMHQLKSRGYDKFLAGTITAEKFMENLSKEWASLPKDSSNLSYYHGDGLNKAGVDSTVVMAALREDFRESAEVFGNTSRQKYAAPDLTLPNFNPDLGRNV